MTGSFVIQSTRDTIFQTRAIVGVHSESSPFLRIFNSWPVLPGMTKVKVSVEVSSNNVSAAVGYDMLVIDETV